MVAGSNALLVWHPWVVERGAPKGRGGCWAAIFQTVQQRNLNNIFYLHDDTKCFTCFTLQPKSVIEKG